MTGRYLGCGIDWADLHGRDAMIARETGSEMRINGLSYFGIPSLFPYTSTITPAFHAVTTRLLARPDDLQARSVSVLRHINPKILAMLGVRYVVTDATYDGTAELRDTIKLSGDNGALYLYEIAHANSATTRLRKSQTSTLPQRWWHACAAPSSIRHARSSAIFHKAKRSRLQQTAA
jgi:hypothetical protein